MNDALLIECLLGLVGGLGTFILSGMAKDVKEVSKNIGLLNERMAIIVERVDSHEGRIKTLEKKREGKK